MAQRQRGRNGYDKDNPFKVTLRPDRLEQPLHWKKPQDIGVCFMGDLFHEDVSLEFLLAVFLTMEKCKQHTFLLLTKRPNLAKEFFELLKGDFDAGCSPWRVLEKNPNIHLGVSVENQATADERIPLLLQIPAAVRRISIEPLLGPVNLNQYLLRDGRKWTFYEALRHETRRKRLDYLTDTKSSPTNMTAIDWVVLGGESGPSARPMKIQWAIDVVNQCKAAGVPVFVKQLHINGKLSKDPAEWPETLRIRELPEAR